MRNVLLAAFFAVIAQGTPSLVGIWRGTSTCVDKKNYPSCNDEIALYEGRALNAPRDSVTAKAEKIVTGAREPMGEERFIRQADGSWRADVTSPRFHLRFSLR